MGPGLKSLRFNLPIVACILTLSSASPAIGADSKVAVDAAKLPGAGGGIQAHGPSFNSSVPFFIKGLANKCIDAGPPELRQLGRVVNLWDCNNSSAQQIDIDEVVPERHEVVLRAGPFCIGPQGGVRNVGVRLELQTCNPTAVEQRFAIDGDSIISLAGPPPNSLVRDRLVIEPERARTMRGTSLVLGERDFDDSEFWTFAPVIPPPENAPASALGPQFPTLPSRQKPTTGFRIVRSEAELRALLPGNPPAPAPGLVLEVVANIELSAGAIVIPAGVTIRGGRGGFQAGSEISAPSNFAIRDPLFIVQGDNVRITGLRIRGPSNSTDSGNPKVDGIRILEDSSQPLFRTFIDHNELSNFTHAAIVGEGGDPDNAFCLPPADYHLTRAKIHALRNFIHHNRRQGEGYGVEVGSGASALIQGNIFENNRHAIAATYDAGNEYYAYGNLVMPPAPLQQNLGVTWHTHDFDVHGVQAGVGFDFEDGWVPPHAGARPASTSISPAIRSSATTARTSICAARRAWVHASTTTYRAAAAAMP